MNESKTAYSIFLLTTLFLSSCATVDTQQTEGSTIQFSAHPKFKYNNRLLHKPKQTLSFSLTAPFSHTFVDIDGNGYESFWKKHNFSQEKFNHFIYTCESTLSEKAPTLSNFKDKKTYMETCMSSHGFEKIETKIHKPDVIQVSIYRAENIQGRSMPVGGILHIETLNYTNNSIINFVKHCKNEADQKNLIIDHQTESLEFSPTLGQSFTYVDIGPYLDFMNDCLLNLGLVSRIKENRK